MKYSNAIPELGQIVKVYYKQEKNGSGGFIPNHEFGIIVKIPENGQLVLKHDYRNFELNEIDWFLEHSKIRFV